MNENLIYMLIGVTVTLVVGVGVYPIGHALRKRRHARKVWARVDQIWAPVHGRLDHLERQGGRLIVANHSDWPITSVMVVEPNALAELEFAHIGPHEKRVVELPEGTMSDVNDDDRVVLQLTDARGRLWNWVPEETRLRDLSPRLPLHARALRRVLLDRDPWPARVARLPRRLRVLLLGEDPKDFTPASA